MIRVYSVLGRRSAGHRLRPLALAAALLGPLLEASAAPQVYRSRHVVLHTDLDAARATDQLAEMETLLAALAVYWRRPPRHTITCYLVDDLAAWPDASLDPEGRRKIAQRAGITLTETLRDGQHKLSARSTVYASAAGGALRHELVHAYLEQNFPQQGPLWFAEGMAEVGQYWAPGRRGVHCPAWMIKHLRSARPRSVAEITAGQGTTGDSWREYAHRWAVCHLLVHHAEYSTRFRQLGEAFVAGQPASFAEAFADVLPRIEFEYALFLHNLTPGYRVDLCRWDWAARWSDPADGVVESQVAAGRGWQASGAVVRGGARYAHSAPGRWSLGAASGSSQTVDADGDALGQGRLEGAVLAGRELGAPFVLGRRGDWTAPQAGQLYVRCRDAWHSLADNDGQLMLRIEAIDNDR